MTRSACTTALLEGETDAFAGGHENTTEPLRTATTFDSGSPHLMHLEKDGSGYMVAVE
jgi:hypothetical protein